MSVSLPDSVRERLVTEAKRRGLSVPGVQLWADEAARFAPFQTDPIGYVETFLGFTPWAGIHGEPGQRELYEAVAESVKRQLAGEAGVKKIFRVESGHGPGKTFGCAGLANWFFDCFYPSVVITTAPSKDQVELLLWKDIKKQRRGKGLGGRVLPAEPKMDRGEDHFAIGRTTNDAGGSGTNRAQGQHNEFSLFILDEAEGVPKFMYDAVEAMMTGGRVVIVILVANPQTRSSEFFKWGRRSDVVSFRFNLLHYPNVVEGRQVIPGGTSREWLAERIGRWCDPTDQHDEAAYTFDVTYPVPKDEELYPPGTIWRPTSEFLFRCMGVAPIQDALRSFVASGVYEAAQKRIVVPTDEDVLRCRIGVDCARFGMDRGSVWVRHRAHAWRAASLFKLETDDYVAAIKKAALEAVERGATSVHVRVDGTGGFGSGVIDGLRKDSDLQEIPDFLVFEVHFASSAHAADKYDGIITECYAEAAETLRGIRLVDPPEELEADLTDRLFNYINKGGRTLKRLEPKEEFRKRYRSPEHPNGRSPDDGDGFALCAAPDYVFVPQGDHGAAPSDFSASFTRGGASPPRRSGARPEW